MSRVLCVLVLVASQVVLAQQPAADAGRYRDFRLGSPLADVATAAGILPTEATVVHQRPALLQDLIWRLPRWTDGGPTTDPVNQIQFSFYNDQLFRIVVEYTSAKTEGMTDTDLIAAFSESYGPPRTGSPNAGTARVDFEGGTPIGRWGDSTYEIVVYRAASYGAPMRLVMTGMRLNELARRAGIESQRLDEQEAPQRELARQKKERDDDRAAGEKAREQNKGAFRP